MTHQTSCISPGIQCNDFSLFEPLQVRRDLLGEIFFFRVKIDENVRFLFEYVYLNLKIANKWHFNRKKKIIRMKMDVFVMKTSNLYSKGVKND